MGLRQAAALLLLGGLVLAFPGRALALEAEEERQGIYEESGAGELYGVLDPETQALLGEAGVEEGTLEAGEGADGIVRALSQLLREEWSGPVKALAACWGL